MGASTSSAAGDRRKQVQAWTLNDVKRAFDRLLHVSASERDTTGAILITRAQFLEVFTDQTVVKDGQYLRLPLDWFTLFCVRRADLPRPDTDERTNATYYSEGMYEWSHQADIPQQHSASLDHVVDALQLFLVLSLFCHGPVAEQLALCFRMFDVDGSGRMEFREMLYFITQLGISAFKIELVDTMPTKAQFEELSRSMFALAHASRLENADEEGISQKEFVAWAMSHVIGKALIKSVEAMKKSKSAAAAALELVRTSIASQAAGGRVQAARQLHELAAVTNFTVGELEGLRRKFVDVAGSTTSTLNREEFAAVVKGHFPNIKTDAAFDTLFNSFDRDGNGEIDFREFTLGLSKISNGTFHDKLKFLFNLLDKDGNGTIEAEELVRFATTDSNNLLQDLQFTEKIINMLDADNSGTVSRDEFSAVARKEPVLFECVLNALKVVDLQGPVRTAFHTKSLTNHSLSIQHLQKVCRVALGSAADRSLVPDPMTSTHFRNFMKTYFKCDSETVPLVDVLFRAVRTSANIEGHEVPLRKLLIGLVQVLCQGGTEHLAHAYFNLFDLDGNGELDRQELRQLFQQSAMATSASVKAATTVLQGLGVMGPFTFERFESTVLGQPSLLNVVCQLVGVDGVHWSSEVVNATVRAPTAERKARNTWHVVGDTTIGVLRAMLQKPAELQAKTRRMESPGIVKLRGMELDESHHAVQLLQSEYPTEQELEEHIMTSPQPATLAAKAHSMAVMKRVAVAKRHLEGETFRNRMLERLEHLHAKSVSSSQGSKSPGRSSSPGRSPSPPRSPSPGRSGSPNARSVSPPPAVDSPLELPAAAGPPPSPLPSLPSARLSEDGDDEPDEESVSIVSSSLHGISNSQDHVSKGGRKPTEVLPATNPSFLQFSSFNVAPAQPRRVGVSPGLTQASAFTSSPVKVGSRAMTASPVRLPRMAVLPRSPVVQPTKLRSSASMPQLESRSKVASPPSLAQASVRVDQISCDYSAFKQHLRGSVPSAVSVDERKPKPSGLSLVPVDVKKVKGPSVLGANFTPGKPLVHVSSSRTTGVLVTPVNSSSLCLHPDRAARPKRRELFQVLGYM